MKLRYLIPWCICFTFAGAYILGNYHYYIGFSYPELVADWAVRLYAPQNQEEVADLSLIMNLALSFIVSCIIAALFVAVRKRLKAG